MITLSVPARMPYVASLKAMVLALEGVYADHACRPSPDAVYAWALAVYEAATNVVRHGHAGGSERPMTLTIDPQPDLVVMRLIDDGTPNPAWPPRDEPPALGESGYGQHIIQRVMDEVAYTRDGEGRNVLEMVARLEPASATCHRDRSS